MEKLKSIFRRTFSYPKLLMESCPVTAASTVAATILFALYTFIRPIRDYRTDNLPMVLLLHTAVSIMIFAVFSLCLENIRPNWSTTVRSITFALLGLLSLFFGFIYTDSFSRRTINPVYGFLNIMSQLRDRLGPASISLCLAGLISVSLLLTIYFSYSHDIHTDFNEHVLNTYSSIFFTSIIYGVIQLGILLLTGIVTILLYDDAYEYIPALLVIINGLFYVPAVAVAITRQNEPANMFIQVLVRYILLINTVLAYIIIYIYMLKLVITSSIPSNSVFAILTALFVISMIISYMCTTFENKGVLQAFAFYSPVIFAPFIIMQAYTVIVRIGQYGITPKRYFGLAFIVFEIVYIIYYMCLRTKREVPGSNLLLILSAFIIITMILPGTGARSVSTLAARRTLSSFLAKSQGDISDNEYIHANAAYGFLSDSDYGMGRLAKYFPELDSGVVSELKSKAGEASSRRNANNRDISAAQDSFRCYFYATPEQIEGGYDMDISQYGRLIHVNISGYKDPDPAHLPVYHAVDDMPVDGYATVDLTDFTAKITDLYRQHLNDGISRDEYMQNAYHLAKIDIDENARLYITEADIDLDRDMKIVSIGIDGYMLLK